ncbi:MAG TPA: hypothetical protein VKF40_11775 [Burkholderiales bacterium]|nr:hypothetical protein [Burkholderiales bacterium]
MNEAFMESAEARRRLRNRYGDGEPRPLVTVLKCLAGLLALVAIGSSPWLILGSGGGSHVSGQPAPRLARTLPSSMAESKRAFDERRRRQETRTARGTLPAQGIAAACVASGEDNPAGK